MKKYLLLILFIFSICLIGCGKYDVQMKKLATHEELTEFFEGKETESDDWLTFSFEMKLEGTINDSSFNGDIDFDIDGSCAIDRGKLTKCSYKAKGKIDGRYGNFFKQSKIKGKLTEKAVIIGDEDSDYKKHDIYLDMKYSYKGDDIKFKYDKKTKQDNDSFIYDMIMEYLDEFGTGSSGNINYNDMQAYIDGDACAIVVSTFDSHTEMIMVFDDNKLEAAKITSISNGMKAEMIFEYGDINKIKIPKDADEYN